MKVLYIDCPSGVSGDMFLGAMLSAGLPEDYLKARLGLLGLSGWDLSVASRSVNGLECADVTVLSDDHHPHRGLSDIESIIQGSGLEDGEKSLALAIFRRLAAAEAKVHGSTVEKIHFHEVGAVDAIVDICGAAIGFSWFGAGLVACSPLPLGSGFVECMHGKIPVPAPATLELLKGVPVYSNGIVGELVTPTGAAVVSTLAHQFGDMPPMEVSSVGYGCGKKQFDIPNVVRLLVGQGGAPAGMHERDSVSVLECNIDDMSPEMLAFAAEKLLASGALDVWSTPIVMKKGRLGVTLSVMCARDQAVRLAEVLLEDTSTFGLRTRVEERVKLARASEVVETPYGPVRVKVGYAEGVAVKRVPEYEDCARAAREHGVAVTLVFAAAAASRRVVASL